MSATRLPPTPVRLYNRLLFEWRSLRSGGFQAHIRHWLPDYYLPGIGPGDFFSTGRDQGRLLVTAGLARNHRLLDLGCGLGRLPIHLVGYFTGPGSYEGIDVIEEIVTWNRKHIQDHFSHFRFRCLDVRNSLYRPNGSISAENTVIPEADETFDFVAAFSLFTHLRPRAGKHYFKELSRVLRPGGRFVGTFFLLTPKTAEDSEPDRTFSHRVEHGALEDTLCSEEAVAYEEDWLLRTLKASNLRLTKPIRPGTWRGNRRGVTYQDLVIAER